MYGCDPNSNIIELLIEENDDTDNQDNKSIGSSKNKDDKLSEADQAINELVFTEDDESTNMPIDVVKRLLGAVSFGYGVFQISLSFMPSNLLKLIKVFGKFLYGINTYLNKIGKINKIILRFRRR